MRNFSFSKKTFLATALLPLFLLSACKPACDYECQRDKAAAEKLKRRNELDHRLNKVGYKQLYDPVAKKEYNRLQEIAEDYLEGKRDSLD